MNQIPTKFNKIQYQLRDNNKRKIYILLRVGLDKYNFNFGNENYTMRKKQDFYFYVGSGLKPLNNTNPPIIYIATQTSVTLTFFQVENGETMAMTGQTVYAIEDGYTVYLNIYIDTKFYSRIQCTDNILFNNPAIFTLPLINKNQAYYFQCCVIK